ncbi:2623_t:CDS:2, partial [Funneliformis geosporum]
MDPNTVKRAASNLQREEQKAKGYTPAGGAAARAQSIADRAARGQTIVQDNPIEQNIDAVDAEAVNDASRMLNREESKLYGGVIPPDTAGLGGGVKNCAAIRANFPIAEQCGLFYFEVDIIDKGENGEIGIGFCTKSASLNKMPGWKIARGVIM